MEKPQSKVLLLGDPGVGKTSLAIQLAHNAFLEIESPDGKYEYHRMVDGQYRVVHLFDNVQTEDWGWSDQIIRECTAFLLVYSITSRSSFDSLAAWVDRIVRGKGEPTGPIVLVGNKADREDLREVSYAEADLLAQTYDALFFEASARTRFNVEQCVLAATSQEAPERRQEWHQKKVARLKAKGKKIPPIPPMSPVSSTYGPDFWSLVGEHKCSDIEFEVAGDIVPAHSVVLIAHSPRFMKSFVREGRRRKAVLGVDEETFRAVLDWIYAGIFPKPESTDMRAYIRLYNAAVKLGVDSLAAVAKAFLQGQNYIEAHRQYAPKGALGLFFNSKMLSDITVIIDGREIRAHKAVLSARSVQWHDIIADYEVNQAAAASYWDGSQPTTPRTNKNQSLTLVEQSAAAGGYHAPAIIFITLLHSPCLQSTDIFPNSGMTRSASSPTLSPHHADFEAGGKKKTKKKDKAAGDLQLYDLYHLMLSYMYTDEVEIAESYALELFLLALDYEVTHLANLAAQVVLDSLTVQSVAGVYEKLVGIHKSSSVLGELRRKIELWISFRFKSVAKTKAFKKFGTRYPQIKAELKRNKKAGFSSSVKTPMSPPESTTAAAAAPRSPQREGGGNSGGLRKSSGNSSNSGSSSGDLLSTATTTTASSTPNGKRLPRFLNSSMPTVPTNRSSFFTSPRATAPVDEPDDELIDLYESYQEYQYAKKIAEARLPVIDQRRKWAKHIGDYLASLQVSGEQFGSLNMANGFPRKVMFVPDEITEISDTLRKLKLDNNLLGNDPIVVYDRQGREQEKIEPLSFAGMRSLKMLTDLSLSQNNLHTVPRSLCHLRSLTSLNLSLCNITAVPSYICYLHALERLTLIGNKLTRLPASLCLMRNLKKLDLASNELSDHSTKPGYFPHSLTSLNLTNNQWNSFPLGIVIKADKEEERQRTKEEIDLKSSAEFFRFLSLGADIHLPSVLSGEAAPVMMSDRPVALAGRVTTEEAERARSGTGELYKALGKGADKFIREQKIQQELLRFAKDAMKREREVEKSRKRASGADDDKALDEREDVIFQRLLKVESGDLDIEVRPLENLVQLNLDGNNISSLPEEIHQLSSLRCLRLCDNYALRSLPDGLARMPDLQDLVIPLDLPLTVREDQIPIYQHKVSPSVWRTLMDFIEVPIPHPLTPVTGPMRLIPEELQLRILSYISQRELADTVSLVCRHWHVLANDASLWHSFPWKLLFSARQEQITLERRIRRLCVMHPDIGELTLRNTSAFPERAIEHLLNRCKKVKTIDLDNSMNYYKSHLGSFLDIITQNLSMLRHIACQNCYLPYPALACVLQAPRLSRLLLVDCEFSSSVSGCHGRSLAELPDTLPLTHLSFERSRIDPVALELVVTRIPNVVDLNLSACEIVPAVLNCIGERCRALLHLNLSHTAITATDVANILNQRKASLQTINIRDIPNVISSFYSLASNLLVDPDDVVSPSSSPRGNPTVKIQEFAQHFAHIRTLTISTTTENEAAGINHFIEGLARTNSSLVSLAIRSTSLSAEHLANLALARSTTLRKIDLSCCNKLDAKAVITITANCKRIEALNLNFLPQLNDSALMEISRKHSGSLRVLSLYQCSSITDEGVLAVIFRCARLKFLSLTKTSVTARSVRAVSELPELQVLCLSYADVELLKKIAQCSSLRHLVLDPFAVGQTGMGEGQGLFPHTAINEYSEQKLLQMHWQLLGH